MLGWGLSKKGIQKVGGTDTLTDWLADWLADFWLADRMAGVLTNGQTDWLTDRTPSDAEFAVICHAQELPELQR